MKLTNRSTSKIQYGKDRDAIFKPGSTVDFPEELAKRLLRLYPEIEGAKEEAEESFVAEVKRGRPPKE